MYKRQGVSCVIGDSGDNSAAAATMTAAVFLTNIVTSLVAFELAMLHESALLPDIIPVTRGFSLESLDETPAGTSPRLPRWAIRHQTVRRDHRNHRRSLAH